MQGGSVDKCLSEEYRNLLEAVLSVPLAIMSSVLHDVCATLTFRAAASAARELQMPPHRWRHHLVVSTSVARVQARPAHRSAIQYSFTGLYALKGWNIEHGTYTPIKYIHQTEQISSESPVFSKDSVCGDVNLSNTQWLILLYL